MTITAKRSKDHNGICTTQERACDSSKEQALVSCKSFLLRMYDTPEVCSLREEIDAALNL